MSNVCVAVPVVCLPGYQAQTAINTDSRVGEKVYFRGYFLARQTLFNQLRLILSGTAGVYINEIVAQYLVQSVGVGVHDGVSKSFQGRKNFSLIDIGSIVRCGKSNGQK